MNKIDKAYKQARLEIDTAIHQAYHKGVKDLDRAQLILKIIRMCEHWIGERTIISYLKTMEQAGEIELTKDKIVIRYD